MGAVLRVTRRQRVAFVFVVAMIAMLAMVAGATASDAATAATKVYHVQVLSGVLHERAAPNTQSAILGSLPDEAAVTIACQTYGEDIQGTTIWDRLSTPLAGAYVTDFNITTPVYAAFTPGIPHCPGTDTRASTGRELAAVTWARGVLHSADPSWDTDDNRPWSGYCETFVERAYGTIYRFSSAIDQYNWQNSQGRIHHDTNPPAGAEVFYSGGNGFGHVALSIGGGEVITTWGFVGDRANVRIKGVTAFSNPYYGWAYAPPNWPGR